MKKIALLTLAFVLVLAFVACAGNGGKTPEITLQEVYDAGKSLSALLGDHESVYVQVISNGKLLREEYLDRQYCYSFYDAEFMDMGFNYASFTTDHSQYDSLENSYSYIVSLTPNGRVDSKEIFAAEGAEGFVSSEVANEDSPSISEKDGSIMVTINADMDTLTVIGDGVVSCAETYTLDAKTREMTSIKTVYTYEDGSVEEGLVTIARDVEAPEGMKSFLAFEQADLRTVTIVSNPGTANEKTETIQAPKGMLVTLSPDWTIDKLFTAYTDAACTQPVLEDPDTNADLTVYIKWDE